MPHRFEVQADVVSSGVTHVVIFLEHFLDDALKFFGYLGIVRAQRGQVLVENSVAAFEKAPSLEGMLADKSFIEHDAERKNVGSPVAISLLENFGSHVQERSGKG